LNAAVKSICDIMRRSNCAGALQYVPELTWILFLRILEEREAREVEESQVQGIPFTPTLCAPFRWRDWAAPGSTMREDKNASVWKFVHERLLPELKTLKNKPGATSRQKVVSEIMSGVDRSRIDSEKNFLDVLDKVHEISSDNVDQTHVFTLRRVKRLRRVKERYCLTRQAEEGEAFGYSPRFRLGERYSSERRIRPSIYATSFAEATARQKATT
jgi:type I restriction enzyme M protein